MLAMGLTLSRRLVSWRGLTVAFATTLITVTVSVIGVNALKPSLPEIFGWNIGAWPDWPEVIPPNGEYAVAILDFLVLGLSVIGYLLARRWSAQGDFSLAGLVPFLIPAIATSIIIPRTAYAFIWPVLIGSLAWITIALTKQLNWSQDVTATMAALPLVALLLVFVPGVVMADGMKSLEILAGIEAALLAVILPAIDGLLVRQSTRA